MLRRVRQAGLIGSVAILLVGCASTPPIARLAVDGEAEPLMSLIRSGQIGVDEPQPWTSGADPRAQATPLCAAISSGNERVVRELLVRGADVNRGCTPHHTPLDWAIETFYRPQALDIAGLLLRNGAVTAVHRGVRTLADVEAVMKRRNGALGHPVPG